jgi:hypothetical protein
MSEDYGIWIVTCDAINKDDGKVETHILGAYSSAPRAKKAVEDCIPELKWDKQHSIDDISSCLALEKAKFEFCGHEIVEIVVWLHTLNKPIRGLRNIPVMDMLRDDTTPHEGSPS